MRFRSLGTPDDGKVELQMTPMIDVVFQLLIFFALTFKIVPIEGDFNVKMPLASASSAPPTEVPLTPILVRLTAEPNGRLTGIFLGERNLGTNMQALRAAIIGIVGRESGPGSIAANTEVELDCDEHLDYRHVIDAFTAVSGYVDPGGNVVTLIDKINFTPPPAG
jgi:biopolymer transport protein ExbD